MGAQKALLFWGLCDSPSSGERNGNSLNRRVWPFGVVGRPTRSKKGET